MQGLLPLCIGADQIGKGLSVADRLRCRARFDRAAQRSTARCQPTPSEAN
jgi:hypothetical protein